MKPLSPFASLSACAMLVALILITGRFLSDSDSPKLRTHGIAYSPSLQVTVDRQVKPHAPPQMNGVEHQESEEDIHLAHVENEILLKVASREDLFTLAQLAMDHEGELIDALPELATIRLRFPDSVRTSQFREQLNEEHEADYNHLVKAPDYQQYETREDQEQTLIEFAGSATEWIGVSDDHSQWGEGVLVAILDTGVYPHSAFDEITISQLDLLGNTEAAVTEYDSHGTAVTSIAIQVAPSSEILSVRVLDQEGIGNSYTVAQGIVAAVDAGAGVINLSIGSYTNSTVLGDAVAYAVDQGVAVVAASGNDGSSAPSYPAAYQGVVSVSALDANGQIAPFSNFGESVDLAAPGVGVYAAWEDDQAIAMSGTSAAAPFVAGAIAALISTGEAATGEQAALMLQDNASDVGAVGIDHDSGYGALQLGGLF